jgi:hypothetical protein
VIFLLAELTHICTAIQTYQRLFYIIKLNYVCQKFILMKHAVTVTALYLHWTWSYLLLANKAFTRKRYQQSYSKIILEMNWMITYGRDRLFRSHTKEKILHENWAVLYQTVLTCTATRTVNFLSLPMSRN